MVYRSTPDDIRKDEEDLQIMCRFSRNIERLLKFIERFTTMQRMDEDGQI